MIKDTITYKNTVILTIYHQNFPQDCLTGKRVLREHISKNVIQFSEEYVPDEEWDNLTGCAWEEHALVPPKENYNPYHTKACAHMTHRIYPTKPSVIYRKDGTGIDGKTLEAILAFIQKYTGMNLKEHPVFLGDMFLFSPSELEFHCTKDNSIVLHHLEPGMRITLHLKRGHDILETKTMDITVPADLLEIPTGCDWNNYDIEICQDGRLVYIDHDVFFARTLHLTLSIPGPKKRIPLNTLQKYYELETQSNVHKSVIGPPPEPVRESLSAINQTLVRNLHNQKISDRFLFVKPGELHTAMDKITDLIFRAADELWLIDSYFTDQNHSSNQMIDWLRLIANSRAARQNIIFYCGTDSKALTAAQLKEAILKDPVIQDTLVRNQAAHMQLIQTKTSIHDRFLMIRNGDTCSGISIGSSFNSLNTHHYCIHSLAHQEVREVLETLYAWMDTNTAAQEEV